MQFRMEHSGEDCSQYPSTDLTAGYVCLGERPWRLAETPITIVIHGRSKERSDARRPEDPFRYVEAPLTVQNSARLHSTAQVTEWIPGSARRRFAAASPWNDEFERLRPISRVWADFME
ncbi:hypothetical protein CK219_25865 [Mesorhizobium sp. WSM4313]|nr:hypothetical protein CK219_25865 [Mesorhizobium sp. WSM4313]